MRLRPQTLSIPLLALLISYLHLTMGLATSRPVTNAEF